MTTTPYKQHSISTNSLTSPALSITSTDGYEQVHKIYEEIFGIQSISKLNYQYIASGQLLTDFHQRITNNNNNDNIDTKTNEEKLDELMEIIDYNKKETTDQQKKNTDIWNILLPEYHTNNKDMMIEWHRLLQVFRIVKYYFNSNSNSNTLSSTPQSDDDPHSMTFTNSDDNNSMKSNLNINIPDHDNPIAIALTSFTPPNNIINNLSQTSFLTQQNHNKQHQAFHTLKFRQIHFNSNINSNTSVTPKASPSPSPPHSPPIPRSPHSPPRKANDSSLSPPQNQVLLSARKVMSVIRGKNLDNAMLASGRKMHKNMMPKSIQKKTKKCTPGRKRSSLYSQTPSTNFLSKSLSAESNGADEPQPVPKKKLDFIHEEEEEKQERQEKQEKQLQQPPQDLHQQQQQQQQDQPPDNDDIDMQTNNNNESHYGWKSRMPIKAENNVNMNMNMDMNANLTANTLNISMLSQVLTDIGHTDDDKDDDNDDYKELNDKIEDLEIEISENKMVIEEYENKITEKSTQCRVLQDDLTDSKRKQQEAADQCKLFDELKQKYSQMELQLSQLTAANTLLNSNSESLQKNVDIKTKECNKLMDALNKKENENISLENELKTLRAKLDCFKNRISKMGKIDLCKSKVMILTADYQSLKKTVKHTLQHTEQEFLHAIRAIKECLNSGKVVPYDLINNNDIAMHDTEAEAEAKESAEDPLQSVTEERDELKSNLLQLNKSYQNEKKLRKRLLEQVIDLKGNIRVFCRVRPKIKRQITNNIENKNGGQELMATTCLDEETLMVADGNDQNNKEFNFDQIYKPNTSQDVIFEDIKPLIHSAMDGYNVCIFAYGQTGSGKTYTMEGTHNNPGVIYRSFDMLFKLKNEQNNEHNKREMKLYLSCLEIYNEKIRDLLNNLNVNANDNPNSHINNINPHNLKAKLSKCGKKVLVPGLTKTEVMDTHNVRDMLINIAYKNRATGKTDMNAHSSRSHALIFIDIISKKSTSRLVLIDLAGSERVKKTGATGAAFGESKSINKSLSALGNVINSLQTKQKHIPYRDSQLTYLLYDCLGGNSRAAMFCNISCELFDVKESLNTLQFAHRVRRVQLGEAQKNDKPNDEPNQNNNNNHNNNKLSDFKLKLKKIKRDLEEKEKEINNLKMNNRNYKKDISKLTVSRDAQSNKNANHHQTRVEFNNLQRDHTRLSAEVDKKDKIIKKLTNDVNEYKHKFVKLRQSKQSINHNINNVNNSSGIRPRTATLNTAFNRTKNPRKRKFPTTETQPINVNGKHVGDNNKKLINGPSQKRRKINNHSYRSNITHNKNKNQSKNLTKNQNTKLNPRNNRNVKKRSKLKNIPSYLAPTRNSRGRLKKSRLTKKSLNTRSRSISIDSVDVKMEEENENDNNNMNLSSISIDSAVSTIQHRNKIKFKQKIKTKTKTNTKTQNKAKLVIKTTAPFTPSSAIEALQSKRDTDVIANNNKKSGETNTINDNGNKCGDNKDADQSKRKAKHVPITVSSLQLQRVKNSAFK